MSFSVENKQKWDEQIYLNSLYCLTKFPNDFFPFQISPFLSSPNFNSFDQLGVDQSYKISGDITIFYIFNSYMDTVLYRKPIYFFYNIKDAKTLNQPSQVLSLARRKYMLIST